MTRAQLLTGTLLDGASPVASVGRVDMLGLAPLTHWPWPAPDPDQTALDVRDWARRAADGASAVTYGGRASGKTDRMNRLAGLRNDTLPRVIVPA